MKTFLATDNNSAVRSFWKLPLLAMAGLMSAFCSSAADLKGDWAEDHLVPFDYNDYGSDYGQVLKEQLLVTPATFARMVVIPAEQGEFAVSVYSKMIDSAAHFRVAYAVADRDIWYEREYGSKEPVPVKRLDVEISQAATLAVCRAWKEMLARVKPYDQEPPFIMVDGTDVVFSVDGVAVQGALPLKGGKHTETLHKIGKLLIAYCKAGESKRPTIATQIEHEANALVENLKKERGAKE